MDHYLDIKLLPDPEFTTPTLMSALFSKLHRILAQLNSSEIGVTFPTIESHNLGHTLRLHGAKPALEKLMEQTWLAGMRDHTEVGSLSPVPASAGYCRVARVQAKSNAERQRRRYQKRHPDERPEVVLELIPDETERRLNLPYVRLKSQSTGQDFPLFIKQQTAVESVQGAFNTYGISQTATLPLF